MDEHDVRRQLESLHASAFGWALSCCAGDREAAEDVLQTAYLKVLSGRARFGGRSSFKTWLFSVIRLTAADHRRRRAIRWLGLHRWHEQRPASNAAEATAGPDVDVDRERLQHRFRALLGRLPARQREVIQLVFYHDHSLSEAAEIMGVSIGSARTHYHRGKRRLREWLREQGEDV